MPSHTVYLNVTGTTVTPTEPPPLKFTVDDEIVFVCDSGDVTIHLDPGHGFDRDSFSSPGPPLTAKTAGNFVLHCSVRTKDGRTLGWPGDAKSGTDTVIKGKG